MPTTVDTTLRYNFIAALASVFATTLDAALRYSFTAALACVLVLALPIIFRAASTSIFATALAAVRHIAAAVIGRLRYQIIAILTLEIAPGAHRLGHSREITRDSRLYPRRLITQTQSLRSRLWVICTARQPARRLLMCLGLIRHQAPPKCLPKKAKVFSHESIVCAGR